MARVEFNNKRIVRTILPVAPLQQYNRSGHTTRVTDYAIQLLFKGIATEPIAIECIDDVLDDKNPLKNQYLFRNILRRLDIEHGYSRTNVVDTLIEGSSYYITLNLIP